MTTKTDQCRAAFEEWVKTITGLPIQRIYNGEYLAPSVELNWKAWQAAWNADKWLPISEAPRDGTVILTSDHRGSRRIVQWDGEFWTDGIGIWNPTHWQPIPKPPKEED